MNETTPAIPLRVAEALRGAQDVLDKLNGIVQSTAQITAQDKFRYREGTDFEEFVHSIRIAEDNIANCVRNLHSAVRIVERAHEYTPQSALQRPLVRSGSSALGKTISCVHSCDGAVLTTCLVEAPGAPTARVELRPDKDFSDLHPEVRALASPIFSKTIPGPQSLLVPLLSTDESSVAIDRDLVIARLGKDGFTVATILCLASKLLWAHEKTHTARKAVFVTRIAKTDIADVLCILPPSISCINLLTGQRPAVPSESQPRLVVCSVKDILENTIRTDDIDHLVVDDCNEATQQIFSSAKYHKLRDVVYRGPSSVLRLLPSPLSAKFHARLWSSERTVNVFDVQPFTMAKQIEELFASFPPGRNYLQTTQTNVFLQNVTVVPTLDALPEDVDHLVIVDLPISISEIVDLLKKAAARFVTLIILPLAPRHLILQALEAEGIRRAPYGLNAPSASPVSAVRY